jgi:hypothetical protein
MTLSSSERKTSHACCSWPWTIQVALQFTVVTNTLVRSGDAVPVKDAYTALVPSEAGAYERQ